GDPINDILFRFQKSGDSDKLLMVTPNIDFQAAPNSAVARAVKRGFPDGYLELFQIEAKQPDRKSLLINISNLFRSDIAQVGQALSGGGLGALFGGASYALDGSKTYVAQMKVFPDNLFVQTAYHFMRAGGARGGIASLLGGDSSTLADPRSVPLTVDF